MILLWLSVFIIALFIVWVVALLSLMIKGRWQISNAAVFFCILAIVTLALLLYFASDYYYSSGQRNERSL